MPKDNRDFFKEKMIWSEIKDELLDCYLRPYFTKILSTGKPVLYVDCFAGKGKFDDGKLGSPLIALNSLEEVLAKRGSARNAPTIVMKFIESFYAKALAANLLSQLPGRCEVISGKFEDQIKLLLQQQSTATQPVNAFFYVDPYGVKILNAALFDSLAGAFHTVELLINLNSFGFIREACRVRKAAFRYCEDLFLSDLEEYDGSGSASSQELDAAAGGDYWREIIDEYVNGVIDAYEAERRFSHLYKARLGQSYSYVLDMPIRLKPGQHPKYRMIHATNHPGGCVLMADNIAKRTDRLVIQIHNAGQLGFERQTADNEVVEDTYLTDRVNELLDRLPGFTPLNEFLARFYNEYGVLCGIPRLSSGQTGSILKSLERDGYIDVRRKPPTTNTGKPTAFWGETASQTLRLRKREQ